MCRNYKNILGVHFDEDFIAEIGDGNFSLLIDKSNDITVNKILGIAIIYFSKNQKGYTYLFKSGYFTKV